MALAPVPSEAYLRRRCVPVTPEYLEYLGQDEMVTIIPNFTMGRMSLICGDVGPFQPNFPVEVPLWMALALRAKLRCSIQPPEWMNKEHLKRLTETERIIGEEGTSWCEVPEYFYEIGRSLLVHARADFGAEADAVEERLGELQKVRWDKIQSGLAGISRMTEPALHNLCATECNMLKPFLIEALGTFMQLERHVEAGHDEYNDWAPGALDPETQQHAGNGSPSAVRRRPRRLRR